MLVIFCCGQTCINGLNVFNWLYTHTTDKGSEILGATGKAVARLVKVSY